MQPRWERSNSENQIWSPCERKGEIFHSRRRVDFPIIFEPLCFILMHTYFVVLTYLILSVVQVTLRVSFRSGANEKLTLF